MILIIITTMNMTIIIYILFFMYGSVCGCVRQYERKKKEKKYLFKLKAFDITIHKLKL